MSDLTAEPKASLSAQRGWTAYFAARCTSDAGTALTWVAMPVLAYSLTGSSAWTAAVVAADAVPYLLFGLIAGHVSDTWNRKRLLVIVNVISALVLLTLPLSDVVASDISPWHVLVVAFIVQTAFVFGDAADFGVLPSIVGKDLVLAANSRLFGWIGVIECVLPAAGGVLMVATSPLLLLTVDAVSFLLCAALLAGISVPFSSPRPGNSSDRRTSLMASIKEGLSYLWSRPLLRDTTLANLAVSIGTGAVFAQLVVWADHSHSIDEGDIGLGFIYAGLSVGSVLGGFAVERVADWGPPRHVIGLLCLFAALCGVAAVWLPIPAGAIVLLGLWGAASLAGMIVGVSLRQSLSPDHLVGRINTAGRMIALGIGFPSGAFLSAVLTETTGEPAIGMTVAFSFLLLVWPLLVLGSRKTDPADQQSAEEHAGL